MTQVGRVQVLVYNIAGEKVVDLLDQVLTAGNYQYSWDGRNYRNSILGNGVYFVLVKTPTGSLTRKVIILK